MAVNLSPNGSNMNWMGDIRIKRDLMSFVFWIGNISPPLCSLSECLLDGGCNLGFREMFLRKGNDSYYSSASFLPSNSNYDWNRDSSSIFYPISKFPRFGTRSFITNQFRPFKTTQIISNFFWRNSMSLNWRFYKLEFEWRISPFCLNGHFGINSIL